VHLSDVAQVVDSKQNLRTAGYLDGKKSVAIIIFRQPGANIIETVNRIRTPTSIVVSMMKKLPGLRRPCSLTGRLWQPSKSKR
jgi:multidrug efflux pump